MSASSLLLSPGRSLEVALPREPLPMGNLAHIPDEIQVFLSTSRQGDGAETALRVLSNETVASVKMRISQLKGLPAQQQVLVWGGRELSRDSAELADYGVGQGDVLHLAVRLSDLVNIAVKKLDGSELTLQLERGSRIYDLKQRLLTEGADEEASSHRELVVRNQAGARLPDNLLVNDALVEAFNGSDLAVTVHLLVRRSARYSIKQAEEDVELEISASTVPELAENEEVEVGDIKSLALLASSKSEPQPLVRRPSIVIETCAELDVGTPVQDRPVIHERFVTPQPSLSVPLGSEEDLQKPIQKLVKEARGGLEAGHAPSLSLSGMGGAYFIQGATGTRTVAIFKPVDEEPLAKNNPRGLTPSQTGEGLKAGTRVGTGAFREVAAYLLDHKGFASVPPTTLALVRHESFNFGEDGDSWEPKLGSLQEFVESSSNCEEMGTGVFPTEEVHKLTVLDCRLANLDRNGENVLMQNTESGIKLVPIDHGYCIPESFEDVWFDWLYWPQARQPYSPEVVEYVRNLDVESDLALLERNSIPLTAACKRVLRVSTMLLQKAVAAGMNAYMIASIMCRPSLNDESPLEQMLEIAGEAVLPGYSDGAFLEALDSVMDEWLPVYKQQFRD